MLLVLNINTLIYLTEQEFKAFEWETATYS